MAKNEMNDNLNRHILNQRSIDDRHSAKIQLEELTAPAKGFNVLEIALKKALEERLRKKP